MGRKSDISSDKVAQIFILHKEGMSQRAISSKLRISQSSVCKCLARINELGNFKARKRSGRHRVTSRRTDSIFRRIVVANPTASATFIATQLPVADTPSVHTIRRRLTNDFKLKAYRPAYKPLLSRKNVKDRLLFCRAHCQWTVDDWAQVMFSDESTIRQFNRYAPYIRRPPGERFNRRYTIPIVKHSPSVMIWGAISVRGPLDLWFVPAKVTVNSVVYGHILEDRVVAGMEAKHCTIFQQDGAPCHTSKYIREWFDNRNIQLLHPWPGSSPDLNPIENCWFKVKSEVSKLKPTSLPDLITKVKSVWATFITPDFCMQLIASMPGRINAVLKAKGGKSKY